MLRAASSSTDFSLRARSIFRKRSPRQHGTQHVFLTFLTATIPFFSHPYKLYTLLRHRLERVTRLSHSPSIIASCAAVSEQHVH